jgi:hypothetical protein
MKGMRVKASNSFSEKLKRYFTRGGPKREVTNFDMGLSVILVLAILAIAAMLVWLIG